MSNFSGTIEIKFPLPDDLAEDATFECDSCGNEVEHWLTLPIASPHRTVIVGDIVPAGACPYCEEGWVYVSEPET